MNRKINSTNYEVYMIDYLEGSLSHELKLELCSFLNDHPEIKSEVEGLDSIKLEESSSSFKFKDSLKKNVLNTGKINHDNFEEYAIAYYENDLTKVEQEHVINYVHEYKSFASDFKTVGKLRLQANDLINYPLKESLQQFASFSHESITADNFEDFLIASYEGDLSNERLSELDQFIKQDDAYIKVADIIKGLTLKADPTIVFDNKAILKRRIVGIPANVKWLTSIAASITLLFASQFIFEPDIISHNITANQRVKWHNEVHVQSNNQIIENTTLIKEVKSKATINPQKAQIKRSITNVSKMPTLASNNIPIEELQIPSVSYPMHALQIRTEEALTFNEKEVKLSGLPAKVVSRMTNFLGKGKHIQEGRLKGHSRAFVEYALLGYNTLTESDRSLQENQ